MNSEKEVMSMWLTPRLRNSETPLRNDRFWNPLSELAPTMAEMFHMPEKWLAGETSFVPSIDLQETDNAYVVRAEMPGIDPNNVNISVSNGALKLQGERREGVWRKGKCLDRASVRSISSAYPLGSGDQGGRDQGHL
jgi:HSP20 family molecular chaperone IbpA